MKIGIMTWFQYHNYGTALQLYALNQKCKNLGYDTYVINYYTRRIHGNLNYITKIKNTIDGYFNKCVDRQDRTQKFEEFFNDNVKFTDYCATLGELEDLNTSLDAFICGSDQIWSPLCFDSHYFLDFVSDFNRMMSYAPSIGVLSIKDKDIEDKIRYLTSRFRFLSVREGTGARMVSELTDKAVETVLDPTLLLEHRDWRKWAREDKVRHGKYAVAYMLGHNESQWKVIYALSKKINLELVVIPVFEKDYKREGCLKEAIGPREFVELIGNSSVVFTDSFHGTAFAVNFNKPLCVFERFKQGAANNQNSRIYNILEITGLTDCIYANDRNWHKYLEDINFGKANDLLEAARKESLYFLERSLKDIEVYIQERRSGGGKKEKH